MTEQTKSWVRAALLKCMEAGGPVGDVFVAALAFEKGDERELVRVSYVGGGRYWVNTMDVEDGRMGSPCSSYQGLESMSLAIDANSGEKPCVGVLLGERGEATAGRGRFKQEVLKSAGFKALDEAWKSKSYLKADGEMARRKQTASERRKGLFEMESEVPTACEVM